MAPPTSADSSHDPWLLAKARYLDGLEPNERTLFNEATLENLYYDTSNIERDDRSSKFRKVIQNLRPLVEKIEDYGKAVDAYANMAPNFISPIWGSIRVLMVVARAYGKFFDRISTILGRIGDILPRFRDYERIFDRAKHQRLTLAISNAYLDIISLCSDFRKLLRDQKASSLKRIWKPLSLDAEFEEAVQRFREHRKTVEKEAETCHMIESAEARALVEAHRKLEELERKAQLRARLLAQLSSQDYHSRHRVLRKLRHEETGNWLLTSPEYKNWGSDDSSAILSLYGIPGSGKSVLISTIFDALMESSSHSMSVVYYCDHADKRTLDPVNILGSIAHALLQSIAEIPSSIQTLIEQTYGDGIRVPQLQEVLAILKITLETSFDTVTIVLDGLDETKEDDRQLMYQCLRDILNFDKLIKLLISSRNDETQVIGLHNTVKYRILLLPEKISTDIGAYVRHAVHALKVTGRLALRNPKLETEISTSLIAGSQGMFLWVKFQLEDLCIAETDAEIRTMLQNLPKDLSETYDRLLSRVMGRQREQLVRRMFEWILCSKRPLHIDEVREAIAFTIDDTCWDEGKTPSDMARLVRACGNLVSIDEETMTLQFAHYTVEQYILSRPVPIGSPTLFSLQKANVSAAEMCLAYLSFTDFETQITTYTDNTIVNMAAVESLVMTNSLLPNQQATNTALRVWSSVRPKYGRPLNRINYSQYIPKLKLPNDILLEKYKLLAYVIEFWLIHTSALSFDINPLSRPNLLFENLLNHKKLIFDFFPWSGLRSRIGKDLVQQVTKIGWALENNHPLLLKNLINPDIMRLVGEAVVFESEWDEAVEFRFVPKDVLDELDQFKGECLAVHDAYRWLYAQCVRATRMGHQCIFYLCEFLPSVVIGHLLVEAAMKGHFVLAAYMLQHIPHPLIIECLDEYRGLKFNALEVAAFQGHPKIVKLLLENKNPHFQFNPTTTGLSTLIRVVKEGKISIVDALWIALFSDGMSPDIREWISDTFISVCSDGNIVAARILLERVDHFDLRCLARVLMAACKAGHREILQLFLPDDFAPELDIRLAFQNIANFPSFYSTLLFLKHIEENYNHPATGITKYQSSSFTEAGGATLAQDLSDPKSHDPATTLPIIAINHLGVDSAIAALFTGRIKSTLECPGCARISLYYDTFNVLKLPNKYENLWTQVVRYFPLNDRPVLISVEMSKQDTIKSLKKLISTRVAIPVEKLVMAEEFKCRFYRFFEDITAVSENIVRYDNIMFYELEAIPTNWPPPKKRGQQKFNSMLSFGDDRSEWENSMAERKLVPVLHRQKPPASGWSQDAYQPVLVPHFIVVTTAEARNEDAIRRKILEKVATFTTYDISNDLGQRGHNEGPTSRNYDNPNVVISLDSDVKSPSDVDDLDKAVCLKEDSKDVDVDSSKKETDGVWWSNRSTQESSGGQISGKFKTQRPKWVNSNESLRPENRTMFDLCYFTGEDEIVPLGWSTVDKLKEYPKLSSRDPWLRDCPGYAGSLKDGSSGVNKSIRLGAGSGSEEDDAPRNAMRQQQQNSRCRRDDYALIRLGEGIVVDWDTHVFDTLFGGDEKQGNDIRGKPTYTDLQLYEDLSLAKVCTNRDPKREAVLEACLDSLGTQAILQQEDSWHCPVCDKPQAAGKTVEIWETPDILVIHLQGSRSPIKSISKFASQVNLPVEKLDLGSKVVGPYGGKKAVYDLFAVDDNCGKLGGELCNAYGKDFVTGQWYNYKNLDVPAPDVELRMTTARDNLLFYRRR